MPKAPQAQQGDGSGHGAAKRKVELMTALINDIRDEDIQGNTWMPSPRSEQP